MSEELINFFVLSAFSCLDANSMGRMKAAIKTQKYEQQVSVQKTQHLIKKKGDKNALHLVKV